MNWFKRAQQTTVTIEDIYRVVDQWILENEEFSEEELLVGMELAEFSAEDQAVPKAAQARPPLTAPKKAPQRSPYKVRQPGTKSRLTSVENQVIDMTLRGQSTQSISKYLGIPSKEIAKILRKRWPTKQDQEQEAIEFNQPDVLDMYEARSGGAEQLTPAMIARALNVNVVLVRKILNSNNISPKSLITQRRIVVRNMIVDLVQLLRRKGKLPTVPEVNKEFEARYGYRLGNSQVHRVMSLCRLLLTGRKESYSLIDAFMNYLSEKRGSVWKATQNQARILKYVDDFINEFGAKHGFRTPPEKEDLKNLLMTKIQLRDRAFQASEFPTTKMWEYVKKDQEQQVLNLLMDGLTPQQVSRKTGIPAKDIQTFYNLWMIKRTPLDFSQKQPSYFLKDDNGNELV